MSVKERLPAQLRLQDQVAYLFVCWKPGKSVAFASVDSNDSTWQPDYDRDKWHRVLRYKLIVDGQGDLLYEEPLRSPEDI